MTGRAQALVLAPVLLVGLTAFQGSFQFDDYNVIVDNPVVQSLGAWWQDVPRGNRPLLKLTYALNGWGGSMAAWHAVNLCVHLLNTLLVHALATHLLARQGAASPHAGACVAALLFGLHPAQTEAVTYLSGRSSSLMALFYLGSLLAYVAGRQRGRWALHAGVSPLLFLLAVFTKESAVSLPLVLLLWEASAPPRRPGPRLWPALLPHAAALLAVAVALLLHPVYGHRVVPDLAPAALVAHALSQVDALAFLLRQLAWPWPLNIDPDLRPFDGWTPARAAWAALLLALLTGAVQALRGRLRAPWSVLGWGLAWFFTVLLPTNSILPRLDWANERQLYLAGVGPFIAAGALWQGLHARRPGAAQALAAVVLVACAALTVRRNADYRTEVTLWEQTVQVSPHKARAFSNLGFAYSAAGCPAQAQAAYREALRLDPAFTRAAENLRALQDRAGPLAEPPLSGARGTCVPR